MPWLFLREKIFYSELQIKVVNSTQVFTLNPLVIISQDWNCVQYNHMQRNVDENEFCFVCNSRFLSPLGMFLKARIYLRYIWRNISTLQRLSQNLFLNFDENTKAMLFLKEKIFYPELQIKVVSTTLFFIKNSLVIIYQGRNFVRYSHMQLSLNFTPSVI